MSSTPPLQIGPPGLRPREGPRSPLSREEWEEGCSLPLAPGSLGILSPAAPLPHPSTPVRVERRAKWQHRCSRTGGLERLGGRRTPVGLNQRPIRPEPRTRGTETWLRTVGDPGRWRRRRRVGDRPSAIPACHGPPTQETEDGGATRPARRERGACWRRPRPKTVVETLLAVSPNHTLEEHLLRPTCLARYHIFGAVVLRWIISDMAGTRHRASLLVFFCVFLPWLPTYPYRLCDERAAVSALSAVARNPLFCSSPPLPPSSRDTVPTNLCHRRPTNMCHERR